MLPFDRSGRAGGHHTRWLIAAQRREPTLANRQRRNIGEPERKGTLPVRSDQCKHQRLDWVSHTPSNVGTVSCVGERTMVATVAAVVLMG